MVGRRRAAAAPASEEDQKRKRLEELEQEKQAILATMPSTSSGVLQLRDTSTPIGGRSTASGSTSQSVPVEDAIVRIAKGVDYKIPPLPMFDGDLDEWEGFREEFEKTTREKEIPDHINMGRLKKALAGIALSHVKDYLNRPSCLSLVMEELKEEFGPNASINQNLLARCKVLPRLEGQAKMPLVKFTMQVKAMRASLERAASPALEQLLIERIEDRMGGGARLDWGKAKVMEVRPTFRQFVRWLEEYQRVIRAVGTESRSNKDRDREGRRDSRMDRHDYRKEESRSEDDWRYRSRDNNRYERRRGNRDGRAPYPVHSSQHDEPRKILAIQTPQADVCEMGCATQHPLKDCPKFGGLNYQTGQQHLRKFGRCFNCFGKHLLRDCSAARPRQA